MKKEIFLAGFLIFTILLSSIILAQLDNGDSGPDDNEADVNTNNENENNEAEDKAEDLKKLGELGDIKNISSKFNISGADAFLEKDIKIPEFLQIPARMIFGIKSGREIPFRIFIVLIAVWFMLFLVITTILRGLIGRGIKSYILGFVVTCLISLSGTTIIVAKFFFDFSNFFGLLKKYKILSLVIAVVILIVIMFVVTKVMKKVIDKSMVDAARSSGTKVTRGGKYLKGAAKSAEELAKG